MHEEAVEPKPFNELNPCKKHLNFIDRYAVALLLEKERKTREIIMHCNAKEYKKKRQNNSVKNAGKIR